MDVSRKQLRELADSGSWARGVDYYEGGRVRTLIEDAGTVTAVVEGTHPYDVCLRMGEGGLEGQCTCPMGESGVFCKHCVAVGLAYIHGSRPANGDDTVFEDTSPAADDSVMTLDGVRQYLEAQKPAVLVDLLLEQARHDEGLLQRLLLKAALFAGTVDTKAIWRAITQATATGSFVEYRSAGAFAQGIEELAEPLDELLRSGHAVEVVELAEHALKRVERALGRMDDSDGYMRPVVERFRELHHAACLAAQPDPKELARRLFRWAMESGWHFFLDAPEDYADVLGEEGLAVYGQLLKPLWEQVPALSAGDGRHSFSPDRYVITSLMESLARAAGDVEALVEVKSRDLSNAYSYLKIAELYREAGQDDKALSWAEQGLAEFGQNPDHRLREFLAAEYARRQRHQDALALVWENFAESPEPPTYAALKEYAEAVRAWPHWRAKALAFLRRERRAETPSGRGLRPHRPLSRDASTLVGVLLWEKDLEAAWQEASAGGCSPDLWMELARGREKEHPEDALAVYQRQIGLWLQHTNNAVYREAVRLLGRVRVLHQRLGREQAFADYVESLRTDHKRKRNFIKLLDRMRPFEAPPGRSERAGGHVEER